MPSIVKYGFICSKNLTLPKPYESYNFYPHVTGEETDNSVMDVNLPKVEQLEKWLNRMKLRKLHL